MGEIDPASEPHLSGSLRTTRGLVAAYHFLIAAGLIAVLVVLWMEARSSQEEIIPLKVLLLIIVPFAILYFATAWGILKWKNWSRTFSLVLNWLNVIAGVLSVARLRGNVESIVSVLLSCLVLWWMSVPAVKLQFQRKGEAR